MTNSFCSQLWFNSLCFVKEKLVVLEKQVLRWENLSFTVKPVANHKDGHKCQVDRFSTAPQEETREKLLVSALSPVLDDVINKKETLFVFPIFRAHLSSGLSSKSLSGSPQKWRITPQGCSRNAGVILPLCTPAQPPILRLHFMEQQSRRLQKTRLWILWRLCWSYSVLLL